MRLLSTLLETYQKTLPVDSGSGSCFCCAFFRVGRVHLPCVLLQSTRGQHRQHGTQNGETQDGTSHSQSGLWLESSMTLRARADAEHPFGGDFQLAWVSGPFVLVAAMYE